jgi:UDP-N-acetylmuramate dehydrogenase
MKILDQVSLQSFNTFGIEAKAKHLVEIQGRKDFLELIEDERWKNNSRLILGGGSNVLFMQDYDGIVLVNRIKGIELLEESSNEVTYRVSGGEVWHDWVMFAVNKQLGGVENMSLIPGCVGSCPIQNIGAYGMEIKDTVQRVHVWNLETGESHTFDRDACRFGYRESIFKHEEKGKWLIHAVDFTLSKFPQLKMEYGDIQAVLKEKGILSPRVSDVSQAIVSIRESKLPNPKEIGNAGSFFKNPVVKRTHVLALLDTHPTMPHFNVDDESEKVPAGWLIEQSGWKGYTRNNHGVHPKQALVIVNYGGATGEEIYRLSQDIMDDVWEKFGIQLEREVNVL